MVEGVMDSSRGYTEKIKGKYPEFNTLKKYASNAGFSEILICGQKGTTIEAQPLFNLIKRS